jgi:exopolyphosphatase/guanosine-5'-triphosphate,3'-diphosphate pyrophosphatase
VGSNTIHLLVASPSEAGLTDRRHAVVMAGLGAEVERQGRLGEELVERVVGTLSNMLQLARADGAEEVRMVATEFARLAPDAGELVRAVRDGCGANLQVLTGEAEARLSYLGATAYRVSPRAPALVADVGGGSTEVVVGEGTRPRLAASLRLGSAQLLRAVSADDPPSPRQLADAEALASMALESAPEAQRPSALLATGGTAANLPVLLGRRPAAAESGPLRLFDEKGEGWTEVSRLELTRASLLTRELSSAELAARSGLSERRSRLMAGGVVIVRALLERYGAEAATVTERGLRDGVILALAASRKGSAAER